MRGQLLEAVVAVAVPVEKAVLLAEEKADEVYLVLHLEGERVDELEDVDCIEDDPRTLLQNELLVRPPGLLCVAIGEGNLKQFVVDGLQNLSYALVDADVGQDVVLLAHGGDEVLDRSEQELEEALRLVGHGVGGQGFDHSVLDEVLKILAHSSVSSHVYWHEAGPLVLEPQHLLLVLLFQSSYYSQNILADFWYVCDLVFVLCQLIAKVLYFWRELLIFTIWFFNDAAYAESFRFCFVVSV